MIKIGTSARVLRRMPLGLRRTCYKFLRRDRYVALRRSLADPQSVQAGFQDLRATFIHIPRTGGTSIAKALFGTSAGAHVPIAYYETVMSPSQYANFKFCFVRNPWDRLVSAFKFLEQGGMYGGDQEWFDRNLKKYGDFNAFVLGYLNERTIWDSILLAPQYHWVVAGPSNQIAVDFVGRYENIENDFEKINEKLDLDCKLSHENISRRMPNCRAYFSEQAVEKVARLYREDIRLFKYSLPHGGG